MYDPNNFLCKKKRVFWDIWNAYGSGVNDNYGFKKLNNNKG